MIRALAPWALAAVGALTLALTFGVEFPSTNQNTYLVHGLVLHDPSLLTRDWYVREATDYHHAFSRLVALLFALQDGPGLFIALDWVLVVASALAWFLLTRRLLGATVGALAWASWLGLGALTRTGDVMVSYLFGGYLQPSSFGIAGYLWALALFGEASVARSDRSRLMLLAASGAALAVGGLFHVNFLLLGMVTLGLAHLAAHRGRAFSRAFGQGVLVQMALPMLVLLSTAPLLLEAARGPTAEALPLLFEVRAPHHFRPTFASLAPFLAWQAAAWWVVVAHRKSRHAVPPVLVQLLAGVGGFVLAASFLSLVLRVPQATQLFPWRFAPVADGLALLVWLGAALSTALGTAMPSTEQRRAPLEVPAEPARAARARLLALVGGAVLAIVGAGGVAAGAERGRAYLIALTLAVLVGALGAARLRRRERTAQVALSLRVPILLVVLGGGGVAMHEVPLEVQTTSKEKRALLRWARKHTPKDRLFAVPPDLESFRLEARRAIVVDWKSAGMLPRDLVTWAARLTDLCGAAPRDLASARQGYASMDRTRARLLVERYGVDLFVFDKKLGSAPSWAPPVHESVRYVVLPAPP